MCFGDGFLWSGANGASVVNHPTPPINGVFQTDMNGKQISHRQIPFGPKEDGGATHGMSWQEDVHKIWIDSNRVGTIMRIDPKTWEVDWMFPMTALSSVCTVSRRQRVHWQVCGTQKPGTSDYAGYTWPGQVRHQDWTGCRAGGLRPGSADIHDVTVNKGQLYGVDAGEHPGGQSMSRVSEKGYPPLNSPTGCQILRSTDLTHALRRGPASSSGRRGHPPDSPDARIRRPLSRVSGSGFLNSSRGRAGLQSALMANVTLEDSSA